MRTLGLPYIGVVDVQIGILAVLIVEGECQTCLRFLAARTVFSFGLINNNLHDIQWSGDFYRAMLELY